MQNRSVPNNVPQNDPESDKFKIELDSLIFQLSILCDYVKVFKPSDYGVGVFISITKPDNDKYVHFDAMYNLQTRSVTKMYNAFDQIWPSIKKMSIKEFICEYYA